MFYGGYLLALPLLLAVIIFLLTTNKSWKRRLKDVGICLLVSFLLLVVVNPKIIGINSYRRVWVDYEVENHFEYVNKNGIFSRETFKIVNYSDTPKYTFEDGQYTYVIYTGDLKIESLKMIEEAYEGYDAIGVAVYEDGELVSKNIIRSVMDLGNLEVLSDDPIHLRTSTDEYYSEFIIEVVEMNTNGSEDDYYNMINERPSRSHYIAHNTNIDEWEVGE